MLGLFISKNIKANGFSCIQYRRQNKNENSLKLIVRSKGDNESTVSSV